MSDRRNAEFVAIAIAIAMPMPLIASAMISASIVAASPAQNPRELGEVHWNHDLDKALAESKTTGKPVLLLFQEIPGCDGCQMFGDQPMSHPLIVEAIETLFVPVAIHNNKPGYDEKILKRFGETAWNYPVMRMLDADGKDIVERRENIFTTADVSKRLIETLATAGRDVPEYLKLVMLESDTRREHREQLTFAMHCFWEGEANLGAIDGVVATRAAFYNDQEVVDVTFDPTVVSIEDITTAADKTQCATTVYAHGDVQAVHAQRSLGDRVQLAKTKTKDAPASDQKYSLAHSNLRWLPMTPMQAMKVNSALRLGSDPHQWLSPHQIALAKQIDAALAKNPKALDGLKPADALDGIAEYARALQHRLK